MSKTRKRRRNPTLDWSTTHTGKPTTPLVVWVKQYGLNARKMVVDHYEIREAHYGTGFVVERVYEREYDYEPSDVIATDVDSLETAKRIAEDDVDALLDVTSEAKIEKAEKEAEAQRQRVEAMSPFNRLFEDRGQILDKYDGGRRHMNVIFNDGTGFSVSAGPRNYSQPSDVQGPFTSVEVGYPNRVIEKLLPHMETGSTDPLNTVYPYTPVEVIEEIMADAGGIKEAGEVRYSMLHKKVRQLKNKLLR